MSGKVDETSHAAVYARRVANYPVAEALAIGLGAAGIAISAAATASGWLAWASGSFGLVLLALAAIDVRHFLLPDALTLPLVPAGLVLGWAIAPETLIHHLIGSIAGFGFFAMVRAGHLRLRGYEGLGFGDVKLMAGIGAFLTWQGLPSVVLLAACTGLATALYRYARGCAPGFNGPLPFGAHLALGAWIVWLCGPLTLSSYWN